MANEEFPLGPAVPPMPAQPAKGLLKKPEPSAPAPELTEQLNALAARLRVSEERFSELNKRLLFIEQNMITNHKKAMTEIKMLGTELSELKRTIATIEDRIITIIKELRLTARKEDIDVMKKYIELWDLTKFVTAEQVRKMLEEQGKGLKEKIPSPEEKE